MSTVLVHVLLFTQIRASVKLLRQSHALPSRFPNFFVKNDIFGLKFVDCFIEMTSEGKGYIDGVKLYALSFKNHFCCNRHCFPDNEL